MKSLVHLLASSAIVFYDSSWEYGEAITNKNTESKMWVAMDIPLKYI